MLKFKPKCKSTLCIIVLTTYIVDNGFSSVLFYTLWLNLLILLMCKWLSCGLNKVHKFIFILIMKFNTFNHKQFKGRRFISHNTLKHTWIHLWTEVITFFMCQLKGFWITCVVKSSISKFNLKSNWLNVSICVISFNMQYILIAFQINSINNF
jgi:hypothetical protein